MNSFEPKPYNPNFVKIPQEIINKSENLDFDNRRVLFFSQICNLAHISINGERSIFFNPKNILYLCLIKTDNRKGGSKDSLNRFIAELEKQDYLYEVPEYDAYRKAKEYTLNEEKFNPSSNFAILRNDEINYILKTCREKKMFGMTASYNLLLVLAYIRKNIYKNKVFNSSNRSETCWRYYINIANDIGLSERAVSACVKKLIEMKIISCDTAPKFQLPNGSWINGKTIFADAYKYDNSSKLCSSYSSEQELKKCKHELATYH